MTKATSGELFAAKWLGCSVRKLRGYSGASSLVGGIENLLARERAKVAEDVLKAVQDMSKPWSVIVKDVRAKYGKGKR